MLQRQPFSSSVFSASKPELRVIRLNPYPHLRSIEKNGAYQPVVCVLYVCVCVCVRIQEDNCQFPAAAGG